MQLDHFVIHVDTDSQLPQRVAAECNQLGFAFDPLGNRNFDSFAAHFLYVGLEYLEIVQLKKPDESGWVPHWIDRYKRGVRGIYCLFIATNDIELLEKELRMRGLEVKAERSSFFDATGSEHPFPWRQIYMPPIPGSDVEVSFIQYDSARADLREIFEPNSDKNGFTGIFSAELSIPGLEESRSFLKAIFPQLECTESGLRIRLDNGEIKFRRGDTVSLQLTARGTNPHFNSGEVQIANVSVETAIV
jgi:hypothetical protein